MTRSAATGFVGTLAAALAFGGACGTEVKNGDTAVGTGGGGEAGTSITNGGAGGTGGATCTSLHERITRDALIGHLTALDAIASDHAGNRAAGTSGYDASVAYVRDELASVGLEVSTPTFEYYQGRVLGPGSLEVLSPTPRSFAAPANILDPLSDPNAEFIAFSSSRPGDVTADLVAVDLQLGLGNTSTSGCQSGDFLDTGGDSVATGRIVLLQRGTCTFAEKAANAEAAGAVGVIIFNQGDTDDRRALFGGSLGDADGHDIAIPVVSTTTAVGEELDTALAGGVVNMRLVADTEYGVITTNNVIVDVPGNTLDEVVVLGAHLDSVPSGAGLNDNGTGSSALVEIAKQLSACAPERTVRFAWWGAEEAGLVGSFAYVNELPFSEIAKILAYINLDMIGSPNHAYFVADGDGAPGYSSELERFFRDRFEVLGIPLIQMQLGDRSDHAAFVAAGLGAGTIFTGAEGIKSVEQANVFGGVSGVAYDACYHQSCDTLANVNVDVMETVTGVMARAVQHFGVDGAGLDL